MIAIWWCTFSIEGSCLPDDNTTCHKAHSLPRHSEKAQGSFFSWCFHFDHTDKLAAVLLVSSSVSFHSRQTPLAPVATTWHTSTSAPSFWSSSSQICCFWDSRSLGPFTSTSYKKRKEKDISFHIVSCSKTHVTRLKMIRYHRVSESIHKGKYLHSKNQDVMWSHLVAVVWGVPHH